MRGRVCSMTVSVLSEQSLNVPCRRTMFAGRVVQSRGHAERDCNSARLLWQTRNGCAQVACGERRLADWRVGSGERVDREWIIR